MDIGYIVSGLLVGILVGLTGVGGGSLMTPLLVFLFGFKPAVAVGTDLLFAAITKTGGVLVHHGNHKSVEWRIVALLALGSLPAALVTIWVLKHLAAIGKDTSSLITFSLGIALLLTALAMLFRSVLQKKGQETEHNIPGRFHHLQAPATVLVGIVIGSLVTISSVGAGVLGTVALLYLYPRMPTLKVVGTDLAHAIPLTAVAGFGHLSMGHVNFTLLGSLLIGSLPGIWIGSHLSAKVPENILRGILATVLLIIGFKFVTQ
jgi:uncharacterized membrane protein YfcA